MARVASGCLHQDGSLCLRSVPGTASAMWIRARRPLLVAYLLLAASLSLFAAGPSSLTAQQQQLYQLVNAERARAGLPQLQWDSHLADAARLHTLKMAKTGELSHQFPGEPNLGARAGDAGAHFNSVAENVAYAGDVPALHNNLMHSPHHRANILSPDSNAIGIALVSRGSELYVTEDFAHLLTSYTSDQFASQVVTAFNRLRQAARLSALPAKPDARLQQAACAAKLDPRSILSNLPGATNLSVFTAAKPADLPPAMASAARDRTLGRMAVGACFKPDDRAGFSKYWVVAVFYPNR